MESNKDFAPIPDPSDRAFEIAHAQGNGLMAREAAGLDSPKPTISSQADQGGHVSLTPQEILNSDDPDKFIKLGELMATRSVRVVPTPPAPPKTFHPSKRPLSWRERRRT